MHCVFTGTNMLHTLWRSKHAGRALLPAKRGSPALSQMSDANRDEAARCMDIARGALAVSDFTKAQRFGEKALRLFPTDEVGRHHR